MMQTDIVYNNTGSVESIWINYQGIWEQVEFDPITKTFNESHLLTQKLRQWEAENGELDLSDRAPTQLSLEPDWAGLLNTVRGTALFAHAYVAAKSDLQTNAAWTLLMDCLTSSHNIQDLHFALIDLQNHIQPPFSAGEIDFINQALSTNDFPFQINLNNQ